MGRWEILKIELQEWYFRDAPEGSEEERVLADVIGKMERIERENPTLAESIEFEKK